MTNAEKQKAWRERRTARLSSRTAALEEIRAMLSGNTKPLALKIIGVIDGALTERKES